METMETLGVSDVPAARRRGRPPKIAKNISTQAVHVPIQDTPASKVIADGAFIIKETSNDADPYTIKRTRVKYHHGICDECGKDLCEGYKMGPYDYLPEVVKAQVREAIEKHKELVHSKFHQRIIASDDMPVSCIDGKEITMRDRLKQMAAKKRLESIAMFETEKQKQAIAKELAKLELEE